MNAPLVANSNNINYYAVSTFPVQKIVLCWVILNIFLLLFINFWNNIHLSIINDVFVLIYKSFNLREYTFSFIKKNNPSFPIFYFFDKESLEQLGTVRNLVLQVFCTSLIINNNNTSDLNQCIYPITTPKTAPFSPITSTLGILIWCNP